METIADVNKLELAIWIRSILSKWLAGQERYSNKLMSASKLFVLS